MAKKSKKLLIIAYVFPPIAYGGTHRTIRLCKYLENLGYEIDVLTIKIQKDLHNDYNLLDKVGAGTAVHRTNTFDIWRLYNRKLKSMLLKTYVGKFLDKIISFLIEFVNKPDHMVYWIPFAAINGYQIINKRQIKTIYTTSPPHSLLITGMLLKKLTGVKWIADLRDPLTFNIASDNWSFIEKWVHSLLERITMKNADAVITNTHTALKELKGKYPKKKIYHIPNSFDKDDFNIYDMQKYPEFTIAHVGTTYQFRNSEVLFQAVAALKDEGVINPTNFALKFVGLNDNLIGRTVAKYNLHSFVKIVSLVEHAKAIEIMKNSHMLLLIKGFSEKGLGQIPGKLYEYLGSGNPIMYIGPEKSEASEIINSTDSGYIVGNNVRKIKDSICKEFAIYKNGGRNRSSVAEVSIPAEYTSVEMANKFNKVFESLE